MGTSILAYPQRFEGIYKYETQAFLDQAWQKAFSTEGEGGLEETDFTIDGLTISVDIQVYAPASSYHEYLATLSILVDNACNGEIRSHFWSDQEEIEIIPARNLPQKHRQAEQKKQQRKALEAIKPLAGIRFKQISPADAFKIKAYYRQFGLEVSLRKPKYFHCSKCDRKTLIKPNKIMPDWPYSKPLESCFDIPLKKAFDLNTPYLGQDKLSYDFICQRCQFPIRLIFMIEISREDYYYPIIKQILEVDSGYQPKS